MQIFLAILGFLLIMILIIYIISASVKVISEGDRALVERLGRYNRLLKPGLNFVWPLTDKIVYVDTLRERVLDVQPQPTISSDNVTLLIDTVVFWQILDLRKAYYAVSDIEIAVSSVVLTTLRSMVGTMTLQQMLSSQVSFNQLLLKELDTVTSTWGIKIIRVDIQDIILPDVVKESMAMRQAAENQKKAELAKSQAQSEAIESLAQVLNFAPNDPRFLEFLLARQNMETHQKIGEGPNAKIIFVDPNNFESHKSRLINREIDTGNQPNYPNHPHQPHQPDQSHQSHQLNQPDQSHQPHQSN